MSAAVVVAMLLLFMAFSSLRHLLEVRGRRRRIEQTPTSPAGDVKPGHVEVTGRIVALETMKSPLGRKDVVYARWELQEERKQNRTNGWATVHTGEERLPFLIQDDSGAVRVEPKGAELFYVHDTISAPMSWSDAPPEVKALLKGGGVDPDSLAGHPFRIVETYIEVGDVLYVHGLARRRADGQIVIDRAESRQIGFILSDHKEEVIVDKLLVLERGSTIGASLATIGATFFLIVAFL